MLKAHDIILRLSNLDPNRVNPEVVVELIQAAKELLKPVEGREWLGKAREQAVASRQASAATRYEPIMAAIQEIDPERRLSFAVICQALNERGIASSSGKPWTGGMVHSVMKRAGALTDG